MEISNSEPSQLSQAQNLFNLLRLRTFSSSEPSQPSQAQNLLRLRTFSTFSDSEPSQPSQAQNLLNLLRLRTFSSSEFNVWGNKIINPYSRSMSKTAIKKDNDKSTLYHTSCAKP